MEIIVFIYAFESLNLKYPGPSHSLIINILDYLKIHIIFQYFKKNLILFELDLTKMIQIAFQSIICLCVSTFENFKKSKKKMYMSLLTYILWMINDY